MIMMARTLTRTVVVTNPSTRLAETLRPGEPVPRWARKLITNPAAWGVQPEDEPDDEEPQGTDSDGDEPDDEEPQGTDSDGDEPENEAPEGTDSDSDEDEVLPEPPRAGRGSSLDAWQSYADALGIEYANDATRDDIVAAVDATKAPEA